MEIGMRTNDAVQRKMKYHGTTLDATAIATTTAAATATCLAGGGTSHQLRRKLPMKILRQQKN